MHLKDYGNFLEKLIGNIPEKYEIFLAHNTTF